MFEVEYVHEIDEFGNTWDENLFINGSKRPKLSELSIVDVPREFLPLTNEEKKTFEKIGVDGNNLRKVNEKYIDLYNVSYIIGENGEAIREF